MSLKNKKTVSVTRVKFAWAETELNRRHKDFQSFALPTELSAQKNARKSKNFTRKNKSLFTKSAEKITLQVP